MLDAFRHQRTNHRIHARFSRCLVLAVLNAFRHQRTNHRAHLDMWSAAWECSTPFGINERTTSRHRATRSGSMSAQRLSASTNEPRRTPTRQPRNTSCAQRLSASTNEPQTARLFLRHRVRAQRLSASTNEPRRNGCRRPYRRSGPSCAQRLSASTNEPLSEPASDDWYARVLNAFRHQRTNHMMQARSLGRVSVCSTPFGINERTTRATRSRTWPLSAQRLSASTNEPLAHAA